MTDYVSKYTLLFKDLASKGLLRTAAVAKTMTRGLKIASTAIAAVGVVGALTAVKLAGSFSERADEIAKFSREAGFAAKGMQELEFIAARQGASFTATKATVRTFNKRLGEMRVGFGALGTSLDKLDPKLKRQLLATKSSEEAYFLFLEVISKVPDAADKAALASAAFSKQGAKEIGRITANGIEGLKQLRAEAVKFRPPLTKEQLALAEKYQDNLVNLKSVLASLGDSAGSALLPIMNELSEKFTDFVVSNREMINLKISAIFKKISESVRKIDFNKVIDQAQRLVFATEKLAKKAVELVNKMGGVGVILKGLLALFIVGKVVAFGAAFVTLAGSIGLSGPLFLAMGANIKKVALAMRILMAAMGPIPLIIMGIITVGVLLYKNWDKVKAVALKLGVDFDKVWLNIKAVTVMVTAAIINKVKAVIAGFKALGNFISNVYKGFKVSLISMRESVKLFHQTVKNRLSSILDFWKKTFRAIGSIIPNFLKSIKSAKASVVSNFTGIKLAMLLILGPIGLLISNYSNLKNVFLNVSSGIKSGVSNSWEGIKSTISNAPEIFNNLPLALGKSVAKMKPFLGEMYEGFSSNLEGIKRVTSSAWDAIKSVISTGVNFWISKINNLLKVYNNFISGPIGKKLGLAETTLINRVDLNNASNSKAASKGAVEVTFKGKVDGAQVQANVSSSGIASAIGSNAPFGRYNF